MWTPILTTTANPAICRSDTFYETLLHLLIGDSDRFPAGRCGGCVPAPPLLSQATNSQPVETGSDWEIPSRFSFQPMAPRKVWTGATPTPRRDWLRPRRALPYRRPIGGEGCPFISIRSSAHATTPPGEKKRADRLPCRMDSFMTPLIRMENNFSHMCFIAPPEG